METEGRCTEGRTKFPLGQGLKGHIPAGKTCHEPVISLDALPTALTAAGGHVNADMKLDGVDLMPFLTGKTKTKPHDRLFWRFGAQWAVRVGDWKLEFHGQGEPQLYSLAGDVGEANDLAGRNPGKVKQLRAVYDEWNAGLMKPRWGRGGSKVMQ